MHYEIIDKIVELVRRQDKIGGSFQQEPYKRDFFRLFVEAAEEGDGLRTDRLWSVINSRAPEIFDGKNWPRLYAAWEVCGMGRVGLRVVTRETDATMNRRTH